MPKKNPYYEKQRAIIVFVLVVSGAAALAHESLWTRRLMDITGATADASAQAFGGLFLGLSLGACFAGLAARRIKRPWRLAGFAEISVALLSLPMLSLGLWSDSIWEWLGAIRLGELPTSWVKFAISFFLIVPVATAMGAVLPLVLSAPNLQADKSSKTSLLLYGVNTAGGLVGLMGVAFLLIPMLGSQLSMLTAICGNVLAGITLLLADRRWEVVREPARQTTRNTSRLAMLLALIAFVSGFVLLAFEVLALQALMLVAPLSYHSPAVFLATVLACLAFGTYAVTRMLRLDTANSWLPQSLPACALVVALTPWLYMMLARFVGFDPTESFLGFVIKTLLFCSFAFGPAFLMFSLIFPLTAAASLDERTSQIPWGRLLAFNGVGGWLGAEFAVVVLMPTLGIYGSLGLIGGCVATLGMVTSIAISEKHKWLLLTSSGVIVVMSGLTLYPLMRLPIVNPHLDLRVVEQRTNREGVICVVEHEAFGRAFLVSNQYLLGSTNAVFDQRRQALIPLALHENPEDVAFIGVATGITVGASMDVPSIETVTAVEISSSVAALAREYFADENRHVLDDERTELVIEDGRVLLTASPDAFDVVIGDLILPWSPGEGRLYTKEHFEAAKRSLKSGGVYCQWLPMYQLTRAQFEMIARTFCSVFPNAEIMRREFTFDTPSVALVGWKDDETIDWKTVAERCTMFRQSDRILDPSVRHDEAIAMLYLGPARHWGGRGILNSLDYPAIEFDAGRERVTGNPGAKYLTGGRWMKLLEEIVQAMNPRDDGTEYARLGALWTQHEVALRISKQRGSNNQAPSLATLILPTPLATDTNANWSAWPGSRELTDIARWPAEENTDKMSPGEANGNEK